MSLHADAASVLALSEYCKFHRGGAEAVAAAQVISQGMQHRRKGSHELNVESSRSQSIMTVYCHSNAEKDADSGASLATMGKINFVDLVNTPGLTQSQTVPLTCSNTRNSCII